MSKRRPLDHIFDETIDGLVEKAVGDVMDHALDAFDGLDGATTTTTTTTTVRVTSSSRDPLKIGARLLEKAELRMQKAEERMERVRDRVDNAVERARKYSAYPVPSELYVMPFTPPVVIEPESLATYRDAPTSFALAPRPRLRVRWWHRLLCRWGHDWRAIVVVKGADIHSLHGLPKGLLVCRRCLRRWDRWPSDIGATRVAEALATARSCDTCGAFQDMPCDAAIHEREDALKGAVFL